MTIRTTHVGSLPRTPELLAANARRARKDPAMSEEAFAAVLRSAVGDVVRRQHEIGLSVINDGEYGHIMTESVDYGAWWFYSFSRLGGLEMTTDSRFDMASPAPGGKVRLAPFSQRRDWVRFHDAYTDPSSGIHIANQRATAFPTITGPLRYIGQDAVRRDIDGLLSALADNGLNVSDGFLAALSPGSAARISNAYYANDTEVVQACADALHQEYKAITDAGLTVQIDDPSIAESWDQINPAPSVADYRDYIQVRIDALNQALEGIPVDQVRFHVCWGSWHGPHTTDIPLAEIVDKVLQVHAHGYSFEAANARHEHEWTVWHDVKLPSDKLLIPGVVGHSTNVVEHPQLVAQRIQRFVDAVGPDRVIASTDCGLGGRVHPSIAWAKLESLAAGAALVG